jgi:YggT family protein
MDLMSIICALLLVLLIVVWVRVILSWFPLRPGTPMASVYRVLIDITEPIFSPLRRIMPATGMLDLTPLIVSVIIVVVRSAIC